MNNKLQRFFSAVAVLSFTIFMTNCSAVQSDNPNLEIVHIWSFENGLVTHFQQYVDTKQLADAEME